MEVLAGRADDELAVQRSLTQPTAQLVFLVTLLAGCAPSPRSADRDGAPSGDPDRFVAVEVDATRGRVSEPSLAALAVADQSGAATDPARGVTFTPALGGFQGTFRFAIPAEVELAAPASLVLAASYWGAPRVLQRWEMQARDVVDDAWVSLGYNDGAPAFRWHPLWFALPGEPSRYLDDARALRVRYQTASPLAASQLDYLAIQVGTAPSAPGEEPATPAPTVPPIPPSASVRTLFHGTFPNDAAPIDYVASVSDLVVTSVGRSKLAQVRAAAPSLTTLRYLKIAGVHGPGTRPPSGDPHFGAAESRGLLWKTPAGEPATQTQNGWYYVDIQDPAKRDAWLELLDGVARDYLAEGYAGFFLDNTGLIEATLIDAYPPDYDPVRYHDALADVLTHLKRTFPDARLLINSYSGWAPEGQRGLELAAIADGLCFEGFSMKTSGERFTGERFRQQLDDFRATVRAGKVAAAIDYGSERDVDRRLWSLAAYLLVAGPESCRLFSGTDAGADLQQYPEDELAIGKPTGDATVRGDGLWVRHFESAIVAENPTDRGLVLDLGGDGWHRLVLHGGGTYPNDGTLEWTLLATRSPRVPAGGALVARPAR